MSKYTVEYKDAIHKTAALFYKGLISSRTMSTIAGDIADTMNLDSKIPLLDDMEALMDAWDKHPVLTPTS